MMPIATMYCPPGTPVWKAKVVSSALVFPLSEAPVSTSTNPVMVQATMVSI